MFNSKYIKSKAKIISLVLSLIMFIEFTQPILALASEPTSGKRLNQGTSVNSTEQDYSIGENQEKVWGYDTNVKSLNSVSSLSADSSGTSGDVLPGTEFTGDEIKYGTIEGKKATKDEILNLIGNDKEVLSIDYYEEEAKIVTKHNLTENQLKELKNIIGQPRKVSDGYYTGKTIVIEEEKVVDEKVKVADGYYKYEEHTTLERYEDVEVTVPGYYVPEEYVVKEAWTEKVEVEAAYQKRVIDHYDTRYESYDILVRSGYWETYQYVLEPAKEEEYLAKVSDGYYKYVDQVVPAEWKKVEKTIPGYYVPEEYVVKEAWTETVKVKDGYYKYITEYDYMGLPKTDRYGNPITKKVWVDPVYKSVKHPAVMGMRDKWIPPRTTYDYVRIPETTKRVRVWVNDPQYETRTRTIPAKTETRKRWIKPEYTMGTRRVRVPIYKTVTVPAEYDYIKHEAIMGMRDKWIPPTTRIEKRLIPAKTEQVKVWVDEPQYEIRKKTIPAKTEREWIDDPRYDVDVKEKDKIIRTYYSYKVKKEEGDKGNTGDTGSGGDSGDTGNTKVDLPSKWVNGIRIGIDGQLEIDKENIEREETEKVDSIAAGKVVYILMDGNKKLKGSISTHIDGTLKVNITNGDQEELCEELLSDNPSVRVLTQREFDEEYGQYMTSSSISFVAGLIKGFLQGVTDEVVDIINTVKNVKPILEGILEKLWKGMLFNLTLPIRAQVFLLTLDVEKVKSIIIKAEEIKDLLMGIASDVLDKMSVGKIGFAVGYIPGMFVADAAKDIVTLGAGEVADILTGTGAVHDVLRLLTKLGVEGKAQFAIIKDAIGDLVQQMSAIIPPVLLSNKKSKVDGDTFKNNFDEFIEISYKNHLDDILNKIVKTTFRTDAQAREYIKSICGGVRKYYRTENGGRYVEVLSEGIAHETNVGYQCLSAEVKKKIDKDVLIRDNNEEVQELVWHFFDDGTNERQGPSKQLKEYLESKGIRVEVYKGTSKLVSTKVDNIIASGFDEAGNLVKRWLVPKGFNSVDDFLKTVNNTTIKNYGYKSIDEFTGVVENTNKYLNASTSNTILNQSLAGGVHANGLKYDILGFPIFEGKNLIFEHDLPENLIKNVTDIEQFENCTMALHDAIKNGKIPESLFTPKQLQQIIDGKPRITGLTWHHHQVTGKMQLVNAEIHQANHLGGNAIWGGGIR
ncbi:HNH endonuclease [Oceanirhabdus sp. W0125-5]|uniref:HNH endonuclease n=1 Tax=Oceanirhabdus sp. W0125-5 TaxID=2999116 RepID=UPI0022F31E1B|nr:HNH endonuclease [Oceanirhabdus sp. W0125-5]WBW95949.1 HNH endonuclease [Oceanirhabdus sp. W0125-5]